MDRGDVPFDRSDPEQVSEEALDKARMELARVARVMSLGTLTASIAHEVNQPLSGIVTTPNTCLRMLAADPPNVEGARETARRTIRDGNRASEVIARLRALFSNKSTAMESVDLNDATREVIALSLSQLQRDRVIFRTSSRKIFRPSRAIEWQLQQVILNLLRNASDAMSAVDNRPRQLLIRTERDDGHRLRLSVARHGRRLRSSNGGQAVRHVSTRRSRTEWESASLSVARSSSAIVAASGQH